MDGWMDGGWMDVTCLLILVIYIKRCQAYFISLCTTNHITYAHNRTKGISFQLVSLSLNIGLHVPKTELSLFRFSSSDVLYTCRKPKYLI
jgi:hypothetical protein